MKTCKRNHKMTKANTYTTAKGYKQCLTCTKLVWKKWYKKNRQKLAKRRRKLKISAAGKAKARKRERMRKQKKNLRGKPLLRYPSAKNHTNERITFAEMVEPISKKYPGKLPVREKPKYFMADEKFQIGEVEIKIGQKFTLTGTELVFESNQKKYKIEAVPELVQYLRRI